MEETSCRGAKKNVGETDRLISVVAGGLLLFTGVVTRRPLPTIAGAALIYRGFLGHCKGYEALGIDTTP